MKRIRTITSLLLCLVLVATATASGATISGTAGNDTLRGGARADRLNGKDGNDKLYGAGGNDVLVGGAGNDLLVGGPGADTLACGAGRDIARAEARDKIAADCEVVTGLAKPAVSVADVSQAEGSAAPPPMNFTVTLAKASPLRVSLAYATADGTAIAGTDYTTTAGQLVFAPGEMSKTLAVQILGDMTVEGDETFALRLSSPVNATLGRTGATGTITNDDVLRPRPGHFRGPVSVGGFVDFDVNSDGASVINLAMSYFVTCQPDGSFVDFARANFTIPIQPDGSFDASGSTTGFTVSFKGRFVEDILASGTIQVHESFDDQGTHYECDTGAATWAAAWRG